MKRFLIKVVSQCLPYIGYPRSLNAIRCIYEAADKVEEKTLKKDASFHQRSRSQNLLEKRKVAVGYTQFRSVQPRKTRCGVVMFL